MAETKPVSQMTADEFFEDARIKAETAKKEMDAYMEATAPRRAVEAAARLQLEIELKVEREKEEVERRILEPILTDGFLAGLVCVGRIRGWNCDYTEVAGFIQWCFEVVGKDVPSNEQLEPYDKGE